MPYEINPLEWESDGFGGFIAVPFDGLSSFRVREFEEGFFRFWWDGHSHRDQRCDSIEHGKQLCQQEFERWIKPVLTEVRSMPENKGAMAESMRSRATTQIEPILGADEGNP